MSDISVILTVFKRPYTLIEQLEAVQAQSVKAEKIIIWKNYSEGIELPDIPENLKENVVIINSSENFGVWARFSIGLLTNTTYVCVFDDDTIPQVDWFKNCLDTMKIKEGLLGTIGILLDTGSAYRGPRYGWDNPNEETIEVDLVGHCWFFKREWLKYLWQYTPDYKMFYNCGEDIMFSYMLQKAGIKTYVPPHPKDKLNYFGSDPKRAWKYGSDSNGISAVPANIDKFNMVIKNLIENNGFLTIENEKAGIKY
jgi:GT2 family glycosyltransferase